MFWLGANPNGNSGVKISDPTHANPNSRLLTVDVLKTAALVCMIVFHFTYDLELFGYIPLGTMAQAPWVAFARGIAGSFLFLAGVSLSLAHFPYIRWTGFLRRLIILTAAALAISVATYFAVPDRFIYFGILHVISLSSLAGLLFLRMRLALVLLSAVLVFMLPSFFRTEALNTPFLTWIGLSTQWSSSLDFEPFFPWFSPFLLGIFCARLMRHFGFLERAPKATVSAPVEIIHAVSRNSLAIYLLHQPILIAVIWGWSKLP